jgi:hypothetical protein
MVPGFGVDWRNGKIGKSKKSACQSFERVSPRKNTKQAGFENIENLKCEIRG